MTDSELIRAAVQAAGISARQFAERVLGRDERTLRRWAAGSSPIPLKARTFLTRWLALSPEERSKILQSL